MASFEGPATSGGDLYGAASSPMTAPSVPEAPKLTPERAQQELARLTAIIKGNPNLHFLEPRVVKCMEVGTQDSATFLSFYRLISQSLSEELVQQKEKISELETSVAQKKQASAQDEMATALAEAAHAVSRVQATPTSATPPAGAPDAAEAAAVPSAQVEELLKRLEQAEVQRERLLQDMQNMRNRAQIDIDVKVFKAIEKFTQSLLPSLDAFHQAMPSLQNATDTASIVTGIEMIHDQLQSALAQAGLTKMVAIGQPFDPHLHEAVGEVPTSSMPDEHIYDELQPGYLFGEKLIRAAVVRLARYDESAPPAPSATQPAAEQPLAEQPAAEQPAAAPPAAEQPAAAPSVAEQPAAEQPSAEQPSAEQPAAEQPATAPPVAEQPAAEQLAAEQPAAAPPVAEQPAAEQPATAPLTQPETSVETAPATQPEEIESASNKPTESLEPTTETPSE